VSEINHLDLIATLQSRIETLKLDVQYEMNQREQAVQRYQELITVVKEFVDKINSFNC